MNLNPHISVDCVIFGFDDGNLKVLLIEREKISNGNGGHKLKLPGSLISENEDLDTSAIRTLKELTGLDKIFDIYSSSQDALQEIGRESS